MPDRTRARLPCLQSGPINKSNSSNQSDKPLPQTRTRACSYDAACSYSFLSHLFVCFGGAWRPKKTFGGELQPEVDFLVGALNLVGAQNLVRVLILTKMITTCMPVLMVTACSCCCFLGGVARCCCCCCWLDRYTGVWGTSYRPRFGVLGPRGRRCFCLPLALLLARLHLCRLGGLITIRVEGRYLGMGWERGSQAFAPSFSEAGSLAAGVRCSVMQQMGHSCHTPVRGLPHIVAWQFEMGGFAGCVAPPKK